jgi:carbonic anhydrase/acetyltransferase-like protein (isoleucine patch superfamily)
MNNLIAYQGKMPQVHSSVFVADGAKIIGDVEIEEDSSALCLFWSILSIMNNRRGVI